MSDKLATPFPRPPSWYKDASYQPPAIPKNVESYTTFGETHSFPKSDSQFLDEYNAIDFASIPQNLSTEVEELYKHFKALIASFSLSQQDNTSLALIHKSYERMSDLMRQYRAFLAAKDLYNVLQNEIDEKRKVLQLLETNELELIAKSTEISALINK